MKNASIVVSPALGLVALLCALPAGAQAAEADSAWGVRPTRSQSASVSVAPPRQTRQQPFRNVVAGGEAMTTATATAASEGGIGVGSQGQSLSIDNHARAAASTAIAPALSGSNDTCMGSSSIGASAMAFGLSFGTTYTDDNCMMLKNARELWNMGFRGAAVARMCMDERNRQALENSGVNCPVFGPAGDRDRRPTSVGEAAPAPAPVSEAVSQRAQPVRYLR